MPGTRCCCFCNSQNTTFRRQLGSGLTDLQNNFTRIMRHQTQFADLVGVLAVDINIVDRLGDSRKGDAQN